MLEITTTRHNPLVDPHLAVWSWEIPVYLFLGGIVAGMMVLAGVNLVRLARGDDPKRFFSVQTPVFAMVLLSLGMGALFLDLEHKPYVWRLYLTFHPDSPMSWGAWILVLVYPVLLATALVRPPELAMLLWPALETASERIRTSATAVRPAPPKPVRASRAAPGPAPARPRRCWPPGPWRRRCRRPGGTPATWTR